MDKFTIYKGKKYKLTGECKQCGKCCIAEVCYIQNSETHLVESVELQNAILDKKIHCNSFDIKTNLCLVHDKKPSICSEYPRLFQELELFPDCGYKWEFVCETDEPDTTLKLTELDKEFKEIR